MFAPRIAFLACTLLLTSTASAIQEATPEPGQRYRVVDVASGDRLNVRDQPGTSAEIVADLAPDAAGVVVTGVRQEEGGGVWWELAGTGASRAAGWVNARFLTPEDPHGDAESDFPLACSGTEPFWSLAIANGSARYASMEGEEATFPASGWLDAQGRMAGSSFAVRMEADKPAERGYAAISRTYAFCSDGMSERQFPFDALIVLPGERVLSGCCARAR